MKPMTKHICYGCKTDCWNSTALVQHVRSYGHKYNEKNDIPQYVCKPEECAIIFTEMGDLVDHAKKTQHFKYFDYTSIGKWQRPKTFTLNKKIFTKKPKSKEIACKECGVKPLNNPESKKLKMCQSCQEAYGKGIEIEE